MHRSALASAIALTCGLLAHIAPAQATSLETFVSRDGTDSGACASTAPCRTLQFAHDQTTGGGVLTVLSAGSYGAVNITKSISILAEGVEALIRTTVACPGGGTAAVCISAATTVSLRGLIIDTNQAGTSDGIRYTSGNIVHVQNCVIRRMGGNGIAFVPNVTVGELYVSNTTVAENKGVGILVDAVISATFAVSFDRVHLDRNLGHGLHLRAASNANVKATIRESFSGGHLSGKRGIFLEAAAASAAVALIDRVTLTNNGAGLVADGLNALARVGDSNISGNGVGLAVLNSGRIASFGTNRLVGNTSGGETPTSTLLLK